MKGTFKKQMCVQAKNSKCNSSSSSFIDPAKYMVNGEFVFRIPPEAPVFEPTIEEFLDPLAYIHKIRPIAEKTGICKIKPPSEWHPPFAVDVDRFKFTPRLQKLNELDANTRVRLYFLDKLATYWNYNGVQIRIPAIDDKTVDMYSLYKIVELEGGFDAVNEEKKWSVVASRMGYVNERTVSSTLRFHYKKLLLPYEKFEQMKIKKRSEELLAGKKDEKGIKKEGESSKLNIGGGGVKRCTRSRSGENDTEILVSETFRNPTLQDKNKELQRLTFYGPGPKILGSDKKKKKEMSLDGKTDDRVCLVCSSGTSEDCILLCDGCDDGYHTYCLVPPLTVVPKGEWRCPQCIDAVVNRPNESFGFEQAEKEYTLQQFGEMADQFKSNYFNMPVHLVSTEQVEQEYWRILSSMDSNVIVEYGADLHSMDHGSGFPTYNALPSPDDNNSYYKSYIESSWNLNNIPVLEGSVLGYINADISGMKVPWMYVGMCFSTFCWHNEDHWSYSINYLHWGEPKTWYGVPGSKAEDFERVMQETTPDLFHNQPDLLHQLVTILNPNILMDKGVPVYHIDQAAGEFVLTFPRAYHAGFNHGYNFAEAVNFAPVDWIPLGRLCIDHYSNLHRYCVFSHDELICKMASLPDNLNSKLAAAAHGDMIKMLETENKQRKILLEWGVINADRVPFELLPDDERQCCECNTTCFLSAVTCKCSPKKLTCLRHFRNLCNCDPVDHTLTYRYTLDELPVMIEKLKEKTDSVSVWAAKVHDALNITTPRAITLSGLKELLSEAQEKHFPDDPSLDLLSKAIKSVQDALAVDFRNILAQEQTLPKKVTIREIVCYHEELKRIPCVLPQENTVKHFLRFLDEFKVNVNNIKHNDNASPEDVHRLIQQANFPNIDIEELNALNEHLKVVLWIEKYNQIVKVGNSYTLKEIDELLDSSANLLHSTTISQLSKCLTKQKNKILNFRARVSKYLDKDSTDTKPSLSELQELLREIEDIDELDCEKEKLTDIIQQIYRWKQKVETLNYPDLRAVENFINEAADFPVDLIELSELRSLADEAHVWIKNIEKLFLFDGENDSYTLLEILTPRKYVCKNNNEIKREHNNSLDLSKVDLDDPSSVTTYFVPAEKRELEMTMSLRVQNTYRKTEWKKYKFCTCASDLSDDMTECSLCKDSFHQACFKKSHFAAKKLGETVYDHLCPSCRRSRYPNVKIVREEVEKLTDINVRIEEGVAVRRLLIRADEWEDECSRMLSSTAITSALEKLEYTDIGYSAVSAFGKDTAHSLESLLLRGYLIGVFLPEMSNIWKLLHFKNYNFGTFDQFLLSGKENSTLGIVNRDKIQKELQHETYSFRSELSHGTVPTKRKRKRVSGQPVGTSDGTSNKIIRSLKNYNPNLGPAEVLSEENEQIVDLIDDEYESGNECDMVECVKPDSEHVDWVQCDCCKRWLHMICIGVTKSQVEKQADFVCCMCKNTGTPFKN